MKLWILGASGMVGSALQAVCQEKGVPYIAHSRSEADITCLERIQKLGKEIEATHIVNCAAFTDVDKAEEEPERAWQINKEGPQNLAMVARHLGARMVHLSTDYVFEGSARVPYTEEDPCSPLGSYGRSKWEGEKALFAEYPKACVIRTSWVFGKKGKNFVTSLIPLMLTKESLSIVKDQWGRPTYVKDLARAILALKDEVGIYHFASQVSPKKALSRLEIAEEVRRVLQEEHPVKCQTLIPVESSAFVTKAKRPEYSALSTEKIEKTLGLFPRNWVEGLKEYLIELRQAGELHAR